jgi:CheY-like chemotaxis protein
MNELLFGRRVLVVEDEILILMMIDGQVFDVAMLDMNLNGKSSGDVADALVARGVPFVYSTGNSAHDTRDGFRDRPVLKEPFSDEQLTKVLSSLLTP